MADKTQSDQSHIVTTSFACPTTNNDEDDTISLKHIALTNRLAVANSKGCYITDLETQNVFENINFLGKEVTSISCDIINPSVLYCSSEKCIFLVDVRTSSVTPNCLFSENEDEINEIAINTDNKLAACDDSGECKMYDLTANKLFRTLRRKHTNICSSLSFIPGKHETLITGGLDSQLILWDFKRVKVQSSLNMQSILKLMGDDSIYMFNPPLVHSIDVSNKCFAAGLGNGMLQIFTIANKLYPSLLINHHSSLGVSTVSFNKSQDTTKTLVTGGNDGIVNVWKLPEASTKKKLPVNKLCTAEEISSLLNSSLDLKSKINFIESVTINNEHCVFVADQTCHVKMLRIT